MYTEKAYIVIHKEGNRKLFCSFASEYLVLKFITEPDRHIHRIYELDEYGNTKRLDIKLEGKLKLVDYKEVK